VFAAELEGVDIVAGVMEEASAIDGFFLVNRGAGGGRVEVQKMSFDVFRCPRAFCFLRASSMFPCHTPATWKDESKLTL